MPKARSRRGRLRLSISPSPTTFLYAGSSRPLFLPLRASCANPLSTRRNMFDPSNIIVGLEVGTSKVCAVVGDVNEKGALNIVGVGQAKSRAVRKGEIVDVPL